ncbi:MAG: hypothetical protein ACKOZL_10485 [Actinomycetes bacterium]
MRFAYLDASSTGMLASGVAAIFAGVVVFVKMRWHQIVGLFRRRSGTAREAAAPDDVED